MERVIQFLLTKDTQTAPPQIQGKAQTSSARLLSMYRHFLFGPRCIECGASNELACNRTASRLVYWLCFGRIFLMTRCADNEPHIKELQQFGEVISALPAEQTTLFVFHTPHHKFGVVRTSTQLGGRAMVLQSNKDTMHTGRHATQFTLHTYLRNPYQHIMFPTDTELTEFVRRMIVAMEEPVTCVPFFDDYFGIRFGPGMRDDYWFAAFPVAPLG